MSTQDIQALCARNNAELCDSVCRSHGVPGEFHADVWLQPRDGPAYYPNAVTLSASDGGVRAEIERLSAERLHGFSVKDSFDRLDLSEFGLRRLFKAEWVWLEADPALATGATGATWERIRIDELQAFEAAWSAGNPPPGRIFLPSLLEDAAVSVLAARRDGRIVAGCIANRDPAGVTGFSNFFAPEAGRSAFRAEAVIQVKRMAGDGAIAGYDSGEELTGLLALRFRAVGSLSVWATP